MGFPGRGAAGFIPRVTGSSAGRWLLLLLSRLRLRLRNRLLPCPTGSPCCSAACCCPGRGDIPSRAQGEAKAKRRGGERGREERRNGRARPNLAPPMGSVAAQRQVTISKLGPCSPGLVGGGKGRRSGREQHGCLLRLQRWLSPSPFPRTRALAEVPPTHLLEISQ